MSFQIFACLAVLCFGNLIMGADSTSVMGLAVSLSKAFHVTPGVAGQLITAFALTICLVGPPLGTITSCFDRQKLLHTSQAPFAGGAVYTSQAAMTVPPGPATAARQGHGLRLSRHLGGR